MNLEKSLQELHLWARKKIWLGYFAIFCRIALAAGFIPSGIVKIVGERFASGLPVNHPMGHYLEALQFTGYYYPFIGVMQILAAVLLLIPRTTVVGLFIYFPIILNITVLSHSVRFEGSLFTSPLMVMACIYLFMWYYHRWKFILPFYSNKQFSELPQQDEKSRKIPYLFLAGILSAMVLVVIAATQFYNVLPRNTLKSCLQDCEDNVDPMACKEFCDCSFKTHTHFGDCLDLYSNKVDK